MRLRVHGAWPLLAIAACLLPLAAYYLHALAALPWSLRLAVALAALASSTLALYLLSTQMRHGLNTLLFVALAACATTAGWFASRPVAPEAVELHFSDGSNGHAPAVEQSVGLRRLTMHVMHPAFEGGRVANGLTAQLADHPTRVQVHLLKPANALRSADGAPMPSDGISVEIDATTTEGKHLSQRFLIDQERFIRNPRVSRFFHASDGIASVEVRIGTGGPGSTPTNDTTLVALQTRSATESFIAAGRGLLAGLLALSAVAALAVLLAKLARPETRRTARSIAIAAIPLGVAMATIAWIANHHASFVYYWDYRNYWAKTETLSYWMSTGQWDLVASGVFASLPADYTFVPAVLPAMVAAAAGAPSLPVYLGSIIGLYAVPAYLAVGLLAARLLPDEPARKAPDAVALAVMAMLVSLPMYFTIVLYLMPDVGGVVFFVAALFLADTLMQEIGAAQPASGFRLTRRMLVAALLLGWVLGLVFLFRRWYAFGVVGTAGACALIFVSQLIRQRTFRRILLWRAAAATALVLFTMLPLLSPVIFAWSANLGQHDYATLYASYKTTLQADAQRLMWSFGWVVLLVAAAWIGLSGVRGNRGYLRFLTVVSGLMAAALFLRVQSPGGHHYYLLMPLFGTAVGAAAWWVRRRGGGVAAGTLLCLLFCANAVTALNRQGDSIDAMLPSFSDWRPKHHPYPEGMKRVADVLMTPRFTQQKVCIIASSSEINQDVFRELWQIYPKLGRHLAERIVQIAQVDSANGPPDPAIRQCELMVVGQPFLFHLKESEQQTLGIVQRDFVQGTGIAAAFSGPVASIPVSEGIRMDVFERRRAISDDEYADLVQRYWQLKAPTAGR